MASYSLNYILFTWSTDVTLLIRLRCQLRVLLIALKGKLSARLVRPPQTLLLIFSTQMNNWITSSLLCFASVSVLEFRSILIWIWFLLLIVLTFRNHWMPSGLLLTELRLQWAGDDRKEWYHGVDWFIVIGRSRNFFFFFYFLSSLLPSPISSPYSPSCPSPFCAPVLPVASSDTFVLSLMVSLTSSFSCFQNIIK